MLPVSQVNWNTHKILNPHIWWRKQITSHIPQYGLGIIPYELLCRIHLRWQIKQLFLPPAYAVEVMFSSCLCVCLSVCLPVWAITFEWVYIEISFLVWCYILSYIYVMFEYQFHWVKVKVISWKMLILLCGHQFNLVWLVPSQGHKWGQGHTKIKVISRFNCKYLTFYQQAGGGPSTERHSCYP